MPPVPQFVAFTLRNHLGTRSLPSTERGRVEGTTSLACDLRFEEDTNLVPRSPYRTLPFSWGRGDTSRIICCAEQFTGLLWANKAGDSVAGPRIGRLVPGCGDTGTCRGGDPYVVAHLPGHPGELCHRNPPSPYLPPPPAPEAGHFSHVGDSQSAWTRTPRVCGTPIPKHPEWNLPQSVSVLPDSRLGDSQGEGPRRELNPSHCPSATKSTTLRYRRTELSLARNIRIGSLLSARGARRFHPAFVRDGRLGPASVSGHVSKPPFPLNNDTGLFERHRASPHDAQQGRHRSFLGGRDEGSRPWNLTLVQCTASHRTIGGFIYLF